MGLGVEIAEIREMGDGRSRGRFEMGGEGLQEVGGGLTETRGSGMLNLEYQPPL